MVYFDSSFKEIQNTLKDELKNGSLYKSYELKKLESYTVVLNIIKLPKENSHKNLLNIFKTDKLIEPILHIEYVDVDNVAVLDVILDFNEFIFLYEKDKNILNKTLEIYESKILNFNKNAEINC